MTEHRLGRIVQHDPRSLRYPAPSDGRVVSRSWQHYGPVLDQGDLGSCTGNAMAQCLNTKPLRVLRTPYKTEVDAVSLYSRATALDGFLGEYPPEDTGSSGLAVAAAAKERGWISMYTHAFGLDHMVAALQNGPVIVGTNWYESMFRPNRNGFVAPEGDIVGGHEYLCTGVNVERRTLRFLNSWGPEWARTGKFHMTFDSFARLLSEQGDVVQPVK